ncbi:MAG TPA: von Willebrand factor type A domain-containing protein [Pirellulales bacterium]|nr:von Willebrand factor type A domain-containing protein [Pirellulales bacterium]
MNQEPDRDESLPNDLTAGPSANGELHDGESLLTAYALGELADSERAEVESRLHESAEERYTAEQTARLGKLLRKLTVESPLPERSSELREAVLAALESPPQSERPVHLPDRYPRRRFWLPFSLAASLLVTCGTLFGLMKPKHAEKVVAQGEKVRVAYGPQGSDVTDLAAIDKADEAVQNRATYELESRTDVPGQFKRSNPPRSIDEMGAAPTMTPNVELRLEGRPSPAKSTLLAKYGVAPVPAEPPQVLTQGGDVTFPQPPGSQRNLPGQARPGLFDTVANGGFAGGMLGGGMQAGRGEQRGGKQSGGQRSQDEQQAMDRSVSRLSRRDGEFRHGRDAQGGQAEVTKAEADVATAKASHEFRVKSGFANAQALAAHDSIVVPNTESYAALVENPFLKPTEHPLSTFSVDVDTASYTNVRRYLNSHVMPPPDAVRIEELINYFQYDYPQPEGETPFSITTDVADCPWNAEHRLLRVGLKGREVPADQRPAGNLVFLLDVSGSMDAPNKLPLVKEAMYLLIDKLTENDRVAIVVYAGNSGLVLPPTNGTNKAAIRQAIGQLTAGGSTNGGQGLQMAYDTAQSQFVKGGTNRVILATDGDFNVGVVDPNDLVRLIEERAKSGVFLSALGFGIGNLKDGTLEKLADKGNGNYAYIDTLAEARRVLVEQLSGTLVTIAKDVKLQIEFNPAQAAEYRLIGYEDRVMPHQDFHDDRKDAGEIGAGHTVTALYEIVPAQRAVGPGGEPLKYQRSGPPTPAADGGELATLKLRYKDPEGQQSRLLEHVITDRRPRQVAASSDLNFAAAVAAFGMLLRESPYRGDATYAKVLALAEQGLSGDPNGYRSEFIELLRQAREISGKE